MRKYVAAWMLSEWHPRPSAFEFPARISVEELQREGDELRRRLENRRILECQEDDSDE